MNDPGLLIVVSGPSGAGKGTICDALRKKFPSIKYSISMTTRAPRPGEIDGKNYFFTTNDKFEKMIAQESFLEFAKVYNHYYGTPKEYVFNQLEQGNHVMLEIDIQGAMQVKDKYPKGVFIYVVPPSLDVLEKRLKGRGTDTDEVISGRLSKVCDELTWIDRYDYVIINDSLDNAITQATSIFLAEQDKITRSPYKISDIIANFKK